MARSKAISVPVTGNTAPLRKSLKNAETELRLFGKTITVNSKQMAQSFGAAMVTIGFAAKKSIEAASDLSETINKTGVIFAGSKDEILDWSETSAKALGQSRRQALDAASTFATFGKAAGLSGTELTGFAKSLTGLSADLASFYNTSPEDAITAIGAALRGESEPIRRYGVLLNDAALKQRAMEMGIYDGNGALTAQQKVLAAYSEILSQTTDAQGDFARTSEGLANQTKILKANIANLTAEVGAKAVPAVTDYTKAANKLVEELKNTDDSQESATAKIVKFQGFLTSIIPAISVFRGAIEGTNKVVKDYATEATKAKTATERWSDSMIALERADLRAQAEAARAARARAAADKKAAEERRKAAQEAAKRRAEQQKKELADLKTGLEAAKATAREYVASIRDRINSEVSLASAVAQADASEQSRTDAITSALEDRRQAYEALNQAKATNDVEAYNKALQDVAASEAAVASAQAVRAKDYTQIFAEQIAAAKSFAADIKTLAPRLSPAALQQILDLGPVAGSKVTKDLIAGTGAITVESLNADLATIAAAGTAAGMATPGTQALLGTAVGGTAAAPTINITAGVGDPAEIAKQVVAVLKTYNARFGKIPIKVG